MAKLEYLKRNSRNVVFRGPSEHVYTVAQFYHSIRGICEKNKIIRIDPLGRGWVVQYQSSYRSSDGKTTVDYRVATVIEHETAGKYWLRTKNDNPV